MSSVDLLLPSPVGLPVLTLPEHSAVLGVSERPPQPWTVGGGDGGLQLRPLPALHQVELLALLQLVALVRVDEGEAVAAGLQLGQSVSAGPVLVTAREERGQASRSGQSNSWKRLLGNP